jgi:hypothetical protein
MRILLEYLDLFRQSGIDMQCRAGESPEGVRIPGHLHSPRTEDQKRRSKSFPKFATKASNP